LARDLRALLLGIADRLEPRENGRRERAALQLDIQCGEFCMIEGRDSQPLSDPVILYDAQKRFENGNRLLVFLGGFEFLDFADIIAHELAVVLPGRHDVRGAEDMFLRDQQSLCHGDIVTEPVREFAKKIDLVPGGDGARAVAGK